MSFESHVRFVHRGKNAWVVGTAIFLMAALSSCVTPPLAPLQEGCGSDDPRIGQAAVLVSPSYTELKLFDHDISGTARIVDNCTIVIENFTYDGNALDLRVAGIINDDYTSPIVLTENLSRTEPYRGETLTITLPDGVTLDDVQHISTLCVVFRVNFADGRFE